MSTLKLVFPSPNQSDWPKELFEFEKNRNRKRRRDEILKEKYRSRREQPEEVVPGQLFNCIFHLDAKMSLTSTGHTRLILTKSIYAVYYLF